MRDINRIEPFCEKLAEVWKQYPDWRFGQFVCNVFGNIAQIRDPFYVEETEMMELLDKYSKGEL